MSERVGGGSHGSSKAINSQRNVPSNHIRIQSSPFSLEVRLGTLNPKLQDHLTLESRSPLHIYDESSCHTVLE